MATPVRNSRGRLASGKPAALTCIIAVAGVLASVLPLARSAFLLTVQRQHPGGRRHLQLNAQAFDSSDELTNKLERSNFETEGLSRLSRLLQLTKPTSMKAGLAVEATASFFSMSTSRVEVMKGWRGVVDRIDDAGDTLVDFENCEQLLWVPKRFSFLLAVSSGPTANDISDGEGTLLYGTEPTRPEQELEDIESQRAAVVRQKEEIVDGTGSEPDSTEPTRPEQELEDIESQRAAVVRQKEEIVDGTGSEPDTLHKRGTMQLVAEASDDDDDDSETGFKLHASSASSEDMFFARRASILDFDLRRHGVGGLGSKSQRQLQRALLSRSLYEGSRQKLGMQHERGLLLYGAPGCGKSLIAGAIGKLLHATSVQYITAADLDSKWFGENGQRVKALFHPGSESKKVGRLADLRLVVVELDGLAGHDRADRPEISRQADESALNLNVLLASLDDFEEQDQTLVVGLTSRKDKIDPALLRPGRLGVHIEVTVPDAAGRLEILKIHTATLFFQQLSGARRIS